MNCLHNDDRERRKIVLQEGDLLRLNDDVITDVWVSTVRSKVN